MADVKIMVVMPEELVLELDRLAALEDRSRSAEIRQLLKAAMAAKVPEVKS